MRKDTSVCKTNSCPYKWTFFNAHTIARHLFSTTVDLLAVFSCFLLAQLTTFSPCSRSWINTQTYSRCIWLSGYITQGTLHSWSFVGGWGNSIVIPDSNSRSTSFIWEFLHKQAKYSEKSKFLKICASLKVSKTWHDYCNCQSVISSVAESVLF